MSPRNRLKIDSDAWADDPPRRTPPAGQARGVPRGAPVSREPARAARPGAKAAAPSAPQEVRIIGGAWKRTKLAVVDRPGLRPTPSRVRETLFNWLTFFGGGSLEGWVCLDAFAGTGALGFEAASRGAASVVMLERDQQLASNLKGVKEKLKAEAVTVEPSDALAWMARSAPARFDAVLLDPPFDADELVAPSLVAARRLLTPGGVVYLEAPRACQPAAMAELGYVVRRQGRAGAVHYHLLQAGTAEELAAVPAPLSPPPDPTE